MNQAIVSRILFILFVLIILAIGFLGGSIVDAQGETCDFPLVLNGYDATWMYYEASRFGGYTDSHEIIYQEQVPQTSQTIRAEFFNVEGYWTIVSKVEDVYIVFAGTDLTLGSDNQFHNPSCYFYADKSAQAIYQYPRFSMYQMIYG